MFKSALLGLCSYAFVACAPASTMDASTDVSAIDGDPGDGSLSPSTATAAQSGIRAIGIAASMTAPLVGEGEQLRDQAGRLDEAGRQMATRTRVEQGVSGGSVVTPPTCAAYVWSGLSVMATFTNCTLEATGESINGSATIAVSFYPTTFSVTFSSLRIGSTTFDGMLSLNVGGECRVGELNCTRCRDTDPMCTATRTNQRTLTGSIRVTSGTTTDVAIQSLVLTQDASGVTVSGAFTVNGTSMSATNVHWNPSQCLPSSGSVALPTTSTTITFLTTTPMTGNVQVQVGSFPSFTQMLFPPCM